MYFGAVFYVASCKAYKDEVAICLSAVHRPTQVIWGANDQVNSCLGLYVSLFSILLQSYHSNICGCHTEQTTRFFYLIIIIIIIEIVHKVHK